MRKNIKTIRIIGCMYFTVLFLVSMALSVRNHQPIWLELLFLSITAATFFINSKRLYLAIGVPGVCISFYVFIACLIYQVQGLSEASHVSFLIGYLTAGTSLAASVVVVYLGMHASEEQKLLLE